MSFLLDYLFLVRPNLLSGSQQVMLNLLLFAEKCFVSHLFQLLSKLHFQCKTKELLSKLFPVPHFSPNIQHGLAWGSSPALYVKRWTTNSIDLKLQNDPIYHFKHFFCMFYIQRLKKHLPRKEYM